jgi:hypothetical protein
MTSRKQDIPLLMLLVSDESVSSDEKNFHGADQPFLGQALGRLHNVWLCQPSEKLFFLIDCIPSKDQHHHPKKEYPDVAQKIKAEEQTLVFQLTHRCLVCPFLKPPFHLFPPLKAPLRCRYHRNRSECHTDI